MEKKRNFCSQPPGSIPEWNSKIVLVIVGRFNSRMGDPNKCCSKSTTPFPFKKTRDEKERTMPVLPIWGNTLRNDPKRSKMGVL